MVASSRPHVYLLEDPHPPNHPYQSVAWRGRRVHHTFARSTTELHESDADRTGSHRSRTGLRNSCPTPNPLNIAWAFGLDLRSRSAARSTTELNDSEPNKAGHTYPEMLSRAMSERHNCINTESSTLRA